MFEVIARIGNEVIVHIEGEATARSLTVHEYRILGCHVSEFIPTNPRSATNPHRWMV